MDDFLHRQSKLSENNLILILEKDLLPTLDEVYQSCQLQTVKAYKYDSYDDLQK